MPPGDRALDASRNRVAGLDKQRRRRVIEASHWQIMMEAPHVQACANTLRAGFAQPQRNRRTRYDASASPKQRILIVGAKFGEMY